LATQPPAAVDLAPLEAAAASAESRRSAVSERLAVAQQHAAELRRLQVELTERNASLRALAQLALQHLDESCPVCSQTYDHDATRLRLEGLLQGVPTSQEVDQEPSDVVTVANELETVERELAAAQASVRTAQVASQQRREWARTLEALTQQADPHRKSLSREDAEALLARSQALVAATRDLRSRGEQLSLGLARAAELTQRVDLEQQLISVNEAIAQQSSVIEMRQSTGELATRVIDALRAASISVVTRQLDRIEPLLQRIFSTVDPHPSFRVVSFLTKMPRGHGQLWTTLDDVQGEKSIQDPSLVLSSSQLNVLAVAIFLALNLAIPTLPLQVVALDDPLQSLDTVNLLGLADLLRRVKATRQVIVSTHDERLASLLVRKLRPVSPDQRTVRIDLRGWTPEGPVVERTEVQQDPSPLRLVASA
jgi:energy-coupling factor transporter ATP-binding protein EcfA2